MAIKINKTMKNGLNAIVDQKVYGEYLMSFEKLIMDSIDEYTNTEMLERAFLMISGSVRFIVGKKDIEVERPNFYNYDPYMLHLPPGEKVKVVATEMTEIAIFKTENKEYFPPKLYTPEDIVIETRGKGHMNEAGTRVVRTILDHSINPAANLMLGEDMHYPGKWAGFPSHYHEQPEIYYYKFIPEGGFGLLKLGEEGVLIEENDTILIPPNTDHPQVAAPGYGMYFIWTIRHLENNPYIRPTYDPKHTWVEKKEANYWPNI